MLPEPDLELLRTFNVEAGTLVALIGGGGKTTLMNRLVETASAAGYRVIATTTTRIRPPHNLPLVLAPDLDTATSLLREAWESSPIVVFAASTTDSGKLRGVRPDILCGLSQHLPESVIICEADGSAGRPLKIHAEYEPVIPECSTSVGIVGGVDALDQPVDGDTIHRFERLKSTVSPLDTVTPALVAQLLTNADTRLPNGSIPVYVLNKADTPERRVLSAQVKQRILELRPGARVIVTVRGGIIDSHAADPALNAANHA